jgi:diacylglycerol kinase (ATP)
MNAPPMNALVAAFFNSMRGFGAALTERAIRQELALLALSIPAALVVSSDLWVRIALVATVLLTLTVELLNTALEKLCDHITPDHHPNVGAIKDMGSAAVFCTLALAALAWGAALIQLIGL